MKKRMLQCYLFSVLLSLSFVFQSVKAQLSDPAGWREFVDSNENVLISDTFRLQTFGDSKGDNWNYQTQGSVKIMDVSSVDIDNLGGKMGLRISPGASLLFSKYDRTHSDVSVNLYYGGNYLNRSDLLDITIYYEEGEKINNLFRPSKDNAFCQYSSVLIRNNPVAFTVNAAFSDNTKGYYCVKYALASGKIQQYSLFEGRGNWQDTLRWSHLPALRNRCALIQGNMVLSSEIYCKQVCMGGATMHITRDGCLSTEDLQLYNTELVSQGRMKINGRIKLQKKLEETGKWYFVSFPFNVYPGNVGEGLEQKDGTPNAGGNFFYVQRYDGERRANSNQASGNWEVLPVINSQETPLFEKNKGYLIALDEKADNKILTVFSEPGEIPDDFAKNGIIPVDVPASTGEAKPENYGWYLCGNPFPAPLSLSRIRNNPALDGYVYVYEGNQYKAYPVGSNYALPSFAAFFVKASAGTQLEVINLDTSDENVLLQLASPLSSMKMEPLSVMNTSASEEMKESEVSSFVRDNTVYINRGKGNGYVRLFNLAGSCLFTQAIGEGSQSVPLTCPSGIYIVEVVSGEYNARYKTVISR